MLTTPAYSHLLPDPQSTVQRAPETQFVVHPLVFSPVPSFLSCLCIPKTIDQSIPHFTACFSISHFSFHPPLRYFVLFCRYRVCYCSSEAGYPCGCAARNLQRLSTNYMYITTTTTTTTTTHNPKTNITPTLLVFSPPFTYLQKDTLVLPQGWTVGLSTCPITDRRGSNGMALVMFPSPQTVFIFASLTYYHQRGPNTRNSRS